MYGRLFGYTSLEKLKAFFPIDKIVCQVTTNSNIAPSQEIFAIIRHKDENRLDKFHWGLVPFWAKDISFGNRMINARAESITELANYPLPNRANPHHPEKLDAIEAVGKPYQTTFDWSNPNQSFPEKR